MTRPKIGELIARRAGKCDECGGHLRKGVCVECEAEA